MDEAQEKRSAPDFRVVALVPNNYFRQDARR